MSNTISNIEERISEIFGKDQQVILFGNFLYLSKEASFYKLNFQNEASFSVPVIYNIKETYESSYDLEDEELDKFLLSNSIFTEEKISSIFIEIKDLMNFINFRFDTNLRKKKVSCSFDFKNFTIDFDSSSRILKKSTYHLSKKYNGILSNNSNYNLEINCFELCNILSFLSESNVSIIRVDLLSMNKIRIVSKRNGFKNIFVMLGKV